MDMTAHLQGSRRRRGVNKAAARLHRVPSNVTTRVKQLQEQLGTKLFERDGRKLTLSASGKVLLTDANQLLRLASEAEAAVRNGKPQGTLRIGALESTSAARLPPFLSKFHLRYPDVSIELVTGTSGALVTRFHEGDIEAAFVAEPFNSSWRGISSVVNIFYDLSECSLLAICASQAPASTSAALERSARPRT